MGFPKRGDSESIAQTGGVCGRSSGTWRPGRRDRRPAPGHVQGVRGRCGHHCPHARLPFDPFHGVALASRALDQVRRTQVKTEPDLKGRRWALLKDVERWSDKQVWTLHWLQRSGLKPARAWRLKEALRSLDTVPHTPEEAGHKLDRWISGARGCRLPAFKRLGATLGEHRDGVIEHFRSGLGNGGVEAMNAQIQAAKARAKGDATDDNLVTIG
ncbi:transposase [Xanthomonas theicola]|uniref:Transposase IS204/IS1001/IS1096/IS1165 DDE domain-containing protein n=1 Tax=Xanthomonas theicola TaxID=56464 RepID=A0A2S6ZJL2_9XANT|nr:transposase [Xanthomonas theicola]PPT92453.1 hypothetical protein XthCFBP4691_03655 [Xanthomonas theicola]QNH26408.1 transposase [Xanthomonas theicola]